MHVTFRFVSSNNECPFGAKSASHSSVLSHGCQNKTEAQLHHMLLSHHIVMARKRGQTPIS